MKPEANLRQVVHIFFTHKKITRMWFFFFWFFSWMQRLLLCSLANLSVSDCNCITESDCFFFIFILNLLSYIVGWVHFGKKRCRVLYERIEMKSRGKSVFTNYVTDGMKSRKHFEKKNQTRKTNKKKTCDEFKKQKRKSEDTDKSEIKKKNEEKETWANGWMRRWDRKKRWGSYDVDKIIFDIFHSKAITSNTVDFGHFLISKNV